MEGYPIRTELSLGDVIERTFSFYMRYFLKYFTVFLAFQALIGVLGLLVMIAFPLPKLPPNATSQQDLNFLAAFFGALFIQLGLTLTIAWVFSSISMGIAIKFTSDALQKGQANMRASIRYAVSKLPRILALSLITGIITFLGFIAFVIPGIILEIMFSLAMPVLLIENASVLDSIGKSRKLVGNRWLKTLGLFIILGVIAIAVAVAASLASTAFGLPSILVTDLVSAIYVPLFPIAITVYYYSNRARLTYPQAWTPWAYPSGFKYCTVCGTQLPAFAAFCSNCGAKQLH